MRLHQRIAGNLAPHSDQRIPELLAGEFPARLSHFVRRADPVGAITAWQFPRDDRDQHRIVRAARGHEEQARIIVSDAERQVAQPADLTLAHAEAESVLHMVAGQSRAQPHGGQPDEPPCPTG